MPESAKQFPPSMKKGHRRDIRGSDVEFDVPEGIIAHLIRECGGNVYDRQGADLTSSSFEEGIHGAKGFS
jgi:hypothetical protein